MAFCSNCGRKLEHDVKFCSECGEPIIKKEETYDQRKTVYDGELHKCPNCGELLKSFEIICSTCGYELRGNKVSNAVKEFALKLENIEAKREYEKPRGIFAVAEAQQRLSKTDEQKISLIKSFSVPNSKEDMLEFMILATSSMNMRTYDSSDTNISKSDKEINAAWFSKVQQVYEKAKRIYSTDSTFAEIKVLYDNCNEKIAKSKRKSIVKWILLVGWIPLLWIVLIVFLGISEPKEEAKEIERLDNIIIEVQQALDNHEFKHALRIADSIDYQRYDTEMERKWDIQREYWVDKVLEEASKNGVELEYTQTPDVDKANDSQSDDENNGGFIEGFSEGLQSGIEAAEKNIEEFNSIINNESTNK